MENQLEPGHCCPIVMTSAAISVLRRVSGPDLSLDPLYVQKLATQNYDGRGRYLVLCMTDYSPIILFIFLHITSIELELINKFILSVSIAL